MAESQEIGALRRRGLRRLVGAIALVLLAVIVLPMVFDAEPRQGTPAVSVRIPSEDDTAFSPKPAPKPAATPPSAPAAKPEPQKPASPVEPQKPSLAADPQKSTSKPDAKAEEKQGPQATAKSATEGERTRAESALAGAEQF